LDEAMNAEDAGRMRAQSRDHVVPEELRTSRLLLRRWRPSDALALAPVLAANTAHLAPWIPWRVAEPLGAGPLASRLAEFAAAFDATREWRYGLFDASDLAVLGEVSLFPRNAGGRVALEDADHLEIGYWVRADRNGEGLATEAARAASDLAFSIESVSRITIHCDERNAASAAIPRRLGFQLAAVREDSSPQGLAPVRVQIWEHRIDRSAHA
jgi:RimJ/RimL family protein N-acetyltransferase